jgi:putative MATE family efflux protein
LGSALFNFASAVQRAMGDIKRPLICLAISCGLNFVLNLMLVLWGNMGLEGVAIATTISLWVMGLLSVWSMMRNDGPARFSFRHLRIHRETLGKILGLGIPAGLQGVFFPLSNIVLQTFINTFGETVIAANSAACNIESIVYQALIGFYHSCLAFVSCNAGAGNWKRVRAVFRQSLCAVTVTGLVLGWGMVVFGKPLLGIYTDSQDIIEQGLLRFLFTGIPYFLCGMMEVVVGMLRGLGSSMVPMILSVLGVCGVRVAWVLTVFQAERFHTVEYIYISYPLSWAITCMAQGIWLFMLIRRNKTERLKGMGPTGQMPEIETLQSE